MRLEAGDVVAVLDANVLYPIALCNTLLTLAESYAEPFSPRWSSEILEETRRNLVADKRCTAAAALRRLDLMNEAFPEALVQHYESLIPSMTNDPDDRHVLAAAIRGGATVVVTENVRHFPPQSTLPFGIVALTTDQFLQALTRSDLTVRDLAEVISRQTHSLFRPQVTVRQVLASLEKHIPNTAADVLAHFTAERPHELDSLGGHPIAIQPSETA